MSISLYILSYTDPKFIKQLIIRGDDVDISMYTFILEMVAQVDRTV